MYPTLAGAPLSLPISDLAEAHLSHHIFMNFDGAGNNAASRGAEGNIEH
jgi:hypothetical protein